MQRTPRVFAAAAALCVVAALVVVLFVVPAVRVDTFAAAAPERAVPALHVLSALFLLLGLLSGLLVRQPPTVERPRLVIGTALVAFSLVVAAASLDAGAAFMGHGLAMRPAALTLLAIGMACVGLACLYLYVFYARRKGHGAA